MDSITHEVRLANWKSVIEQCQARPSGQTQKQWLAENQISEKSYYYWQRKLRKEAYAIAATPHSTVLSEKEPLSFVEVPFSARADGRENFCPDAVLKTGKIILEVSNTASPAILKHLLEAAAYVK